MGNRRDFIKAAAAGIPLLVVSEPDFGPGLSKPLVVSTWDSGIRANAAAWKVLSKGGSALDAVEQAARSAEDEASCCVGLDGYPDRDGFVTLDAAIMDHDANCGSVVFVQGIKHPVSVARKLMETTKHVMLAGEGAVKFAISNGFELLPIKRSADAEKAWQEWLRKSEYKPVINIENRKPLPEPQASAPNKLSDGSVNHDTMGTIALGSRGDLSAACTTSGMAFKIHGRVGDSPIIGAGLYVDNEVGAATSSGVGEEVIRICGTHLVIEQMRLGLHPTKACREAVMRIARRKKAAAKDMQVGFVAISKKGEVGAFALQKGFSYSVTSTKFNGTLQSDYYFK